MNEEDEFKKYKPVVEYLHQQFPTASNLELILYVTLTQQSNKHYWDFLNFIYGENKKYN